MRKSILAIIMLSAALLCYGQDDAEAGNYTTSNISLTLSPYLGGYAYFVGDLADPQGIYDIYYGGLNVVALEYEYRFFEDVGAYIYFEGNGHLYEGHENSSSAIARYWGLGNIKIGAGGRVALSFGQFELSTAGAVYFAGYIPDFDEFWPGIGVDLNGRMIYKFSPNFGIGLTAFTGLSSHPGGPYPDDPHTSRIEFWLWNYGIGLTLTTGF